MMLLTGCGASTPAPQVVTEYQLVYPEPLPERLTVPISAPELPSGLLSNHHLLQQIADYHRQLQRANSDREEVRQLWPEKPND